MRTRQKQRSDFDTPWKEAIELYFPLFMLFFFAEIYAEIEWSRGYEFMDKELQQAAPRGKTGRRTVDKLVKVWLKDNTEVWLLLHIEVQNQEQVEFPERMFVYAYRLFDHYHRPVVSLAILGDSNPHWRPEGFGYRVFGTGMQHGFKAVKLLDFESQWPMLEKSKNPFALMVMIHLRTISTQGKPQSRMEWKLQLAKGLYDRGLPEKDIIQMFKFMDWMMALTPQMEKRFESDLKEYEEERKMPVLSPFERRAIRKGKREGMREGKQEAMRASIVTAVELRFGQVSQAIHDSVSTIRDAERMDALLRSAITAGTLEEFKRELGL